MNRIKLYIDDVINEMLHKVTWPPWQELQGSAIIVMVATAIISVIVMIMDFAFSNLMHLIYSIAY
ncbi:MAG: preprotein translocase subunit SecE [Bacteroidia bacterium]|nr:preprotein translocase subunit SecE [Bacteroidia bacterium]